MPEFGRSIVVDQGFKNVKTDDKVTGFQVRVRVSYYRGIVLSILDGYDITVDDKDTYSNDDIEFSLDGENFIPVNDLKNHTDYQNERWEFGDKAYLRMKKEGGLARGRHKIKVVQKIAVPYLPFSTAFFQEKVMTII